MHIDLDRVLLREPSMQAWEILCSESQERMLALVAPGEVDEVVGMCARWGVDATPIGAVTDDDRLVFERDGQVVHDAPARALADEGPVYERPIAPWVHPAAGVDAEGAAPAADLRAAAVAVLTSPNIAPPTWITRQYDGIVGSGTFQAAGASAAVLRLPPAGGWGALPADTRGLAIATDGNGRWCTLDPELGARLVVAEAARYVACTGARPVAATNCLNFGSPERPEVMGAFSATVDGMTAACVALGTPISGGNVSFYNATDDRDIHPTPVVGVLGILDDVTASVPVSPPAPDVALCVIGADPRPGLGGSEYQWVTEGRIAGTPPAIDLEEERRLQDVLVAAAGAALLRSAPDVATGGLVTTLVELCGDRWGADVDLDDTVPTHQWLFSEAPSRVVVTVDAARVDELAGACTDAGLGCRWLGTVTDDRVLRVGDALALDLDVLGAARERVFTDLFEAADRSAEPAAPPPR
jgi:phosphoribosylformylglycinamidine synthase